MHTRNDSVVVNFLESSGSFQPDDVWGLYLIILCVVGVLCMATYFTANKKEKDIE